MAPPTSETVQLIALSGDDLPTLLRAAADWLDANPGITLAALVRQQANDEENVDLYYWPPSTAHT